MIDSAVVTDPSLVIYHVTVETVLVVTFPTFRVIFRDPEVTDPDPEIADGQATCCVRGMCDLGLVSGHDERVRRLVVHRYHHLDQIRISMAGDDPLLRDYEPARSSKTSNE